MENNIPKIAPLSRLTQTYVMHDNVWKVDFPAYLKEIMDCSPHTPYKKTFAIVGQLLHILAQRAIEINDPALNIIMLNLSLYDGSHTDEAQEQIAEQRKIIKEYINQHNKQ